MFACLICWHCELSFVVLLLITRIYCFGFKLQIRIHPFLPYGIMGVVYLQSAILAVFLPETNGQSTLETMDDMINQGKGKNQGETIALSKKTLKENVWDVIILWNLCLMKLFSIHIITFFLQNLTRFCAIIVQSKLHTDVAVYIW